MQIDRETYNRLVEISKLKPWNQPSKLEEFLSQVKPTSLLTRSQQNSIHLYLTHVSQELQNEGHTMQDVVAEIKKAEITPTMQALKEVVWKPMQKAMYGKDSTTQLSKLEVSEVYENCNRFFARFGVSVPFPSLQDGEELDGKVKIEN